jgi:hypothetical protein
MIGDWRVWVAASLLVILYIVCKRPAGGLSFFNIARGFAYLAAVLVLLAYAAVGYALYAYRFNTWSYDDPRMLIPGAGITAFLPAVALMAFSVVYRRRLLEYEFRALAIIALLGVAILPVIFASSLILPW